MKPIDFHFEVVFPLLCWLVSLFIQHFLLTLIHLTVPLFPFHILLFLISILFRVLIFWYKDLENSIFVWHHLGSELCITIESHRLLYTRNKSDDIEKKNTHTYPI